VLDGSAGEEQAASIRLNTRISQGNAKRFEDME
jgi:hypothetical protein